MYVSALERGRVRLSGCRGVLINRKEHTPPPLSRGESHRPPLFVPAGSLSEDPAECALLLGFPQNNLGLAAQGPR